MNLNFYVRLLYVQCMTQNKWSFMNKFNFLTSAKILFKECPISTKLTETEGNKFCNNRKGQSTDDYSSSSLPLQQSCRLPLRIWEIRFFAKWLIIPPHFFSLHLSECLEGLSEIPLGTMECLGSPAHQCSCSPSLHHWQGEQMATPAHWQAWLVSQEWTGISSPFPWLLPSQF